jgi:FkbM family methyltransferase
MHPTETLAFSLRTPYNLSIRTLSFLFRIVSKVLSGHNLGKNPLVAVIYLKIAKVLLPQVISYKGNKIHLDSPDAMSLSVFGRYYEEYEISLFEQEIENGSVVLDLGANIGLYTLIAAKSASQVFAFEPDPKSFSNLKKNIEANNAMNVHLVNKAVRNKTGKDPFCSYSKYPLDRGNLHIVTEHEKMNQNFIVVETISLDEFFRNKSKKIDVIKMDIEGLEFEALEGMKELLSSNKKVKLFMEFNPYTLNRRGVNMGSFVNLIFEMFSNVYHVDEDNKTMKRIDKQWLIDFAQKKEDGHFTNLLAIKSSF